MFFLKLNTKVMSENNVSSCTGLNTNKFCKLFTLILFQLLVITLKSFKGYKKSQECAYTKTFI